MKYLTKYIGITTIFIITLIIDKVLELYHSYLTAPLLPVSLNFCILSLILVTGPQAL